MFPAIFILGTFYKVVNAEGATEDIDFLKELPLDKLLRLKTSLQDLVTTEHENVTVTAPSFLESFGAQAMAMQGAPIKRGDYEEHTHVYKKDSSSKINHIFSMSVTTLAFLAFGGYLLCLIVQATRAKQMYYNNNPAPAQPATFLVSAGIKKRPQPQFAAYGRRRRENRGARDMEQMALPPEQLFSALLEFCEGYAKWSEKY